eukprot:XP_016656700.1 PREDICTED: uncharacterized protein LOC107882613 [Acyrthosiphon pisum]
MVIITQSEENCELDPKLYNVVPQTSNEMQSEENCELVTKLCNVIPQTSNEMQAEEICEPKSCYVPQTSSFSNEMQSSREVEKLNKVPESSLPSTIDGDNEKS